MKKESMKSLVRNLGILVVFATSAGCAGAVRGCSSQWAENAGADWVIVQYNGYGEPFRCWALEDVAVTNEENSDGIYWQNSDGHLIHLSGHYNRIQVSGGDWDSAFGEIGLTRELCTEIQTTRWDPALPPEHVDPE